MAQFRAHRGLTHMPLALLLLLLTLGAPAALASPPAPPADADASGAAEPCLPGDEDCLAREKEANLAAESRRMQVRLAAEQRRREEAFFRQRQAAEGNRIEDFNVDSPHRIPDGEEEMEQRFTLLAQQCDQHRRRVEGEEHPPDILKLTQSFVEFRVPKGTHPGAEHFVHMGEGRSVPITIPEGVKEGDILEVTVPREDLTRRRSWGSPYPGNASAQLAAIVRGEDAKAASLFLLREFESHSMQAQACASLSELLPGSPYAVGALTHLNTSTALTRSLARHRRSPAVQHACLGAASHLIRGNQQSLQDAIEGDIAFHALSSLDLHGGNHRTPGGTPSAPRRPSPGDSRGLPWR